MHRRELLTLVPLVIQCRRKPEASARSRPVPLRWDSVARRLAASLRLGPTGFHFEFSLSVVVAFVIASVTKRLNWKLATRGGAAGRLAIVFFALAGIAGFFYPVRFVPQEKRMASAAWLARRFHDQYRRVHALALQAVPRCG